MDVSVRVAHDLLALGVEPLDRLSDHGGLAVLAQRALVSSQGRQQVAEGHADLEQVVDQVGDVEVLAQLAHLADRGDQLGRQGLRHERGQDRQDVVLPVAARHRLAQEHHRGQLGLGVVGAHLDLDRAQLVTPLGAGALVELVGHQQEQALAGHAVPVRGLPPPRAREGLVRRDVGVLAAVLHVHAAVVTQLGLAALVGLPLELADLLHEIDTLLDLGRLAGLAALVLEPGDRLGEAHAVEDLAVADLEDAVDQLALRAQHAGGRDDGVDLLGRRVAGDRLDERGGLQQLVGLDLLALVGLQLGHVGQQLGQVGPGLLAADVLGPDDDVERLVEELALVEAGAVRGTQAVQLPLVREDLEAADVADGGEQLGARDGADAGHAREDVGVDVHLLDGLLHVLVTAGLLLLEGQHAGVVGAGVAEAVLDGPLRVQPLADERAADDALEQSLLAALAVVLRVAAVAHVLADLDALAVTHVALVERASRQDVELDHRQSVGVLVPLLRVAVVLEEPRRQTEHGGALARLLLDVFGATGERVGEAVAGTAERHQVDVTGVEALEGGGHVGDDAHDLALVGQELARVDRGRLRLLLHLLGLAELQEEAAEERVVGRHEQVLRLAELGERGLQHRDVLTGLEGTPLGREHAVDPVQLVGLGLEVDLRPALGREDHDLGGASVAVDRLLDAVADADEARALRHDDLGREGEVGGRLPARLALLLALAAGLVDLGLGLGRILGDLLALLGLRLGRLDHDRLDELRRFGLVGSGHVCVLRAFTLHDAGKETWMPVFQPGSFPLVLHAKIGCKSGKNDHRKDQQN